MSTATLTREQKRKKQTVRLSTKTTLNLNVKEVTLASPSRLIPALLLIVLVSCAVGKFAVLDRYEAIWNLQQEIEHKQQELSEIEAIYADYKDVKDQYTLYNYEGFDHSLADRLVILDLLEEEVFPVCNVHELGITGYNIIVAMDGMDLTSNYNLIQALEEHDTLVDSVTITSASTQGDGQKETTTENQDNLISYMTISLVPQTVEEEA